MTNSKNKRRPRPLPLGLKMIYEDADLLVVDKPGGLLSMATDRERERTAYFFMTDYVRKGNARSRNRIFIVHRLDRETSGVLLFAKTESAKIKLQDNWDSTRKTYLAIVQGHPAQNQGSITSYLTENAAHVVHSTMDESRGRFSQTDFRVIKRTPALTLLELNLVTGRKNQIRVHLSEKGLPIVGDKKYGPTKSGSPRLALHARKIQFVHPVTGQEMVCEAEVPPFFQNLIGNCSEINPSTERPRRS